MIDAPVMDVSQRDAEKALSAYKIHRSSYDTRDWEIEKIYRAIAKGKKVISVRKAIQQAGVDSQNRPKLAIAPAHLQRVRCVRNRDEVVFTNWPDGRIEIKIPFPGMINANSCQALMPRIPPQHRPAQSVLKHYHILFEADWTAAPPVDPYLLRRISSDAWIILAAWELTEVELSVIRG